MAEPVLRLEAIRKSYNPGTPTEVDAARHRPRARRARVLRADGTFRGRARARCSTSWGCSTIRRAAAVPRRARSDRAGRPRARGCAAAAHRLRVPVPPPNSRVHAHENVLMPLLIDRGRPDAGMRARADELLESVGLALARQPGEQALGRARWRVWARARHGPGAAARRRADRQPRHQVRAGRVRLDARSEPLARHHRAPGYAHARARGACDRIVELVDGQIVSDRRALALVSFNARSITARSSVALPC